MYYPSKELAPVPRFHKDVRPKESSVTYLQKNVSTDDDRH